MRRLKVHVEADKASLIASYVETVRGRPWHAQIEASPSFGLTMEEAVAALRARKDAK